MSDYPQDLNSSANIGRPRNCSLIPHQSHTDSVVGTINEKVTTNKPTEEIKASSKPEEIFCRVCYKKDGVLIQPCNCKGSMAYIHSSCLGRWLENSLNHECEICHYPI